MRDFLTVLAYTFGENVRKKSFIISTVIVLLLTVALMVIPSLITNASESPSENYSNTKNKKKITKYFYVVDKLNMFNKDLAKLKKDFPEYQVELKDSTEVDALISKITTDENTFLLLLDERDGKTSFDYYYMKFLVGPDPDVLGAVLKKTYVSSLLKKASVDVKLTDKVLNTPDVIQNEVGKGYFKSVVASFLIIFILFFAIYYFGYGIAMSVASEKTSRVMETLITSTKPSRIIFGKTAAMGLLGLLQLSLMLFVAIISYRLFFPKDFKLFGQSLDFSAFTPLVIVMVVLYFILGYLLYALLNAVAGACVSKAEDVNSAIMPVSMVALISFYIAYFPATLPNSEGINAITSMIPFTAAFSMPSRLVTGSVSPVELVISIALLVVTIALLSWVSVKIYSAAILHYGSRLKLGDLIKMIKNK